MPTGVPANNSLRCRDLSRPICLLPPGSLSAMARKVVNRKELRAEHDAAEAQAKAAGEGAPAAEAKGKKAAKPKGEKKAPVKRKSRAKSQEPERLRLFWGVFNQSLKRVA